MSDVIDPSVAAARSELRALLTRRDFVATTGGIVAGMAGLSLGACSSDTGTGGGGGGGTTTPGGIPSGAQTVTGTASLPAGSSLKITDMSVDILTQTVPVSASGGFTVGISTSGPSLALLTDSNGDGVLMAMWDPAASTQVVSTHTTAVATLYHAVGAYMLPAGAMSRVLSLLDGDPAIAALDGVLAAAVVADPQALANNASALGPAVTAALQAIFGSTDSRVAPTSARLEDPIPTLMLLTPSDAQDGVQVSQDTSTTSLLIANFKRRPCKVYIYETTTLTGNVTTDVLPAKRIQGPIDLDSTENLSLFTSIKDLSTFFHGSSPWSPVNLPAIPLALETGTDRTSYQVIVLASALKVVSGDAYEPAFFRDAHFVNEVAQWRTDDANLFYRSVFGDILLPIFCFFGGFGVIAASRSVIAGVVAAAAAAKSAAFLQVIDEFDYGSFGSMAQSVISVVRTAINSDISTQLFKPQIQAVLGPAEARALAAESEVLTTSRLLKGSKMFLSVFQPILAAGLALESLDLGAVLADVYNSDIGASWTALMIRQLLNLAPQNPTISTREKVVFKVSNPVNVPGGMFVYDWTQTGLFATLSAEGEVNVGQAITTSQTTVDFVPSGGETDPISVLVVGYDTSSGARVEIGRAGTTVSFLLPAEITPTNHIASIDTQVVFVVTVGGTPPNGSLTYRWTLTGTGGSLGGSNVVTTTVPYVTWGAENPGGTDNLHVDVYSGTTLIAKADVSVSVAGPPFIDFTIAGPVTGGPFTQYTPLANGHFHFGPAYVGEREPSPDTGLDGIYMAYDIVGSDQSNGVSISILVPSGATPAVGQVLGKWTGEGNANQFQFDISTNLSNPDDPNASFGAPDGTGTLTVNGISLQNNGEWLMQYTFQIVADGGGTISGTGTGKWGANGVVVTQ